MNGVTASKFCVLLLDTCRPSPPNSVTDREEKKRRIGAEGTIIERKKRKDLKSVGSLEQSQDTIM